MDARTADFYDRYARELAPGAEAAVSAAARRFATAFAAGTRVLDVGAGTGRDVAQLLARGWDAWGVEPSPAMRARAIATYPQLAGRLAEGRLPGLGRPFGGGFDGALCSAVLMHLAPADLAPAITSIVGVLRPVARLLVAVPALAAACLVDGRDEDGRAFHNHAPATLDALLGAAGFAVAAAHEEAHDETRWHTRVYRRDLGAGPGAGRQGDPR